MKTRQCWSSFLIKDYDFFKILGHGEAVIAVCFSPDGRQLASGSGDKTVRFWDVFTETPLHTCEAHTHWVLCIAWSPDCKKLASGCKNGQVKKQLYTIYLHLASHGLPP